jgi:hypothetical protein
MEYTLFFPADSSGYAFCPEASFATLEEAITAAADTADAYVEIDAKLSSLDVPRLSL